MLVWVLLGVCVVSIAALVKAVDEQGAEMKELQLRLELLANHLHYSWESAPDCGRWRKYDT